MEKKKLSRKRLQIFPGKVMSFPARWRGQNGDVKGGNRGAEKKEGLLRLRETKCWSFAPYLPLHHPDISFLSLLSFFSLFFPMLSSLFSHSLYIKINNFLFLFVCFLFSLYLSLKMAQTNGALALLVDPRELGLWLVLFFSC